MRLSLVLLIMGVSLIAAADYEFKDFLNQHRDGMWEMDQKAFNGIFTKKASFRPNDKTWNQLRYALTNRAGVLRLDGMTIYEALVSFEENRLNRVTLSIFSRGDGGHWDQGNVDHSIEKVTALMKEYYPEVKPASDFYNMAGQKINALNWKTPEAYYQLKWSMSGSKSSGYCEYLTFIIDKDEIGNLRQSARITVTDKKDLLANIKTRDGYRYLEIPMVDQGMKGYCVVAVLERILRYYGSEVDQHQLAQLANTETYGTNRDDMIDAIKKADSRVGVRMKELYVSDFLTKTKDFLDMVDDYNKVAKKARRKTINPDDFKVVRGNYYHYNTGKMLKQMDGNLFAQARSRDRREVNKFIENIKKNVDAGIPLGWCVILGLVEEKQKTPQIGGGHMRLIIGYNDSRQELVFTDSWGARHEFKTMSYTDALAMTTWLGTLSPRPPSRL